MGNKEAKDRHSYRALTPNEVDKLKVQTNFSEKEIRDWHAGFYRDCPNGELDKKKFIDIFEKFYVRGPRAKSFCEYVFGMFDKDKSGFISFSEFLLAIASSTQGDTEKRLGLAFDMYDVESNGEIDQNELANLLLAMDNLVGKTNGDPKKRAIEIMEKLDKDGNNKLSKAEFIDELKKHEDLIYMLAPKL